MGEGAATSEWRGVGARGTDLAVRRGEGVVQDAEEEAERRVETGRRDPAPEA